MHELSVVMSIVQIAQEQASTAGAYIIEEIELDIGCLTTVEMNAFEFAWHQAVKETILASAAKKINRIKGRANCLDCAADFEITNLYDACPVCGQHLISITAGKELAVKSLVVS
jgi:hydrogenase nickel incorporation protein HypA/HybF